MSDDELHTIQAGDLADALNEAGWNAVIQQTGGGTATIYASRNGVTVLAGPGSFNWKDPRGSEFYTGDLYVGQEEDEDGGIAAVEGSTPQAVAALFEAAASRQSTEI